MSATPGSAYLQARGSSPSVPARAGITPFPCKRRVHWSSFDSQEAWSRVPSPSLQRLRCEYTDKQPSHGTDDDSPGTVDKEAGASYADAGAADQELPLLSDEHGDALLQDGYTVTQHATSGGTVKLHRGGTAQSMRLDDEGEGKQTGDGDRDSQAAQAGVLGLDGDGATLSLGGRSEGTEAAAEQSDESTGVESGSSGESTTKEKPEDRGQELQGTKIAAAPDLMQSRPAMMSAPPQSAEGEASADPDEYESEQSAEAGHSTGPSIAKTAGDLPDLPSVLPWTRDLPGEVGSGEDEPDGRSLHTLLPLKPGALKVSEASSSVTATSTPDGTMFSFEPTEGAKKSGGAPAGLPADSAAPDTAPAVPDAPKDEDPFTGESTEEGGVQRSGKTVPAQDAILSAGQRHKASGGASPGAAPLEADPVDVDFDDELSSDEEFLLIEMEADDSGDDGAPMATPPRDLADGAPPGAATRGPSSPFEPAATEGFFKDVQPSEAKSAPLDGSSTAVPGEVQVPLSTAAPGQQSVRPVDNARDTSSTPPPAVSAAASTDAAATVQRHPSSAERGTGTGAAQTSGGVPDSGRYSVMQRGAGSVRTGPARKGTELQLPKVTMPGDADPPPAVSPPSTHSSAETETGDDVSASPTDPHDRSDDVSVASTGIWPSDQLAQQGAPHGEPKSSTVPETGVSGLLSDTAPVKGSSSQQPQSRDPPGVVAVPSKGAETPPSATQRPATDSSVSATQQPHPPQGKPGAEDAGSAPGSISSHPLDDVPPPVADEATVALVRQQNGQSSSGNGNGRNSGGGAAAATAGPDPAVDGSAQSTTSQTDAHPAAREASEQVPKGGTPEMPGTVRDSSRPAANSTREPPTDAASAIAIAALAGAATGIPPSGLVKGVRSRHRNPGSMAAADVRNSATAAPSMLSTALDSSDSMSSIDPDDAGKDFTPPQVSSPPPPPPRAPQSAPSSSTKAIAKPEPQLSGPPLDDPPETLIHPFHLTLFAVLLIGAVAFAITVINFTTDMGWLWSAVKVFRKLAKSLAFRQSIALMVAIAFVRYGLEPLVRSVRSVFSLPGPWERSTEYFILKQVYQPLEFLLFVAAISTVVEAVLPPLVAVQKETVRIVVRTMLSLTYVIASAFVVFNIKARIVQEKRWRAELSGDAAAQRSLEATNKLLTVLFLFVATLLGLQAIGLDIQSVLAISGFGGLALGLAGREILENVFNGLLIVSSRSFVVGEEIMFTQSGHAGRIIEGIIMDIGWYRTLIRSFEREVYIVPNSVFSRTVVLNVTRKGKEWRVFENIGVRVEDISAVPSIIGDMRRIIRNDVRVLPKLHRRVFLDKVNRNELTIYISFYIEAANRDAFMATKQEIFLEFALACERHGAQLASNRHQVQLCTAPSGAASLRMLSDATLDPDTAPGTAEEEETEEETSTGAEDSEAERASAAYYQDRHRQ